MLEMRLPPGPEQPELWAQHGSGLCMVVSGTMLPQPTLGDQGCAGPYHLPGAIPWCRHEAAGCSWTFSGLQPHHAAPAEEKEELKADYKASSVSSSNGKSLF